MADEFDEGFYEGEYEEEELPRIHDNKIDKAKQALMARFFQNDDTGVYYGRQLEVAFEADFSTGLPRKPSMNW